MSRAREIVSLHLGQAGVQIADAAWEVYCLEHGVPADGKPTRDNQESRIESFFHKSCTGQIVPRAVFIDLEPTVIDEIRVGAYRDLFHPDNLVTGQEDAANNFARGHYTVGRNMLADALHRVRRSVEICDSFQGFLISHSFGGGTGSGFNNLLLDRLESLYTKSCKIQLSVYPSPQYSTAVVEPYNAVMNVHSSMDATDISLLFDNHAIYDICHESLSISRPTYTHLNRVIAQVMSSASASLRFEGTLNADLNQLQTNLVPYPRIHFPLISYAPILSPEKITHESLTTSEITRKIFESSCQVIKCDLSQGKFMSCCLSYRGNVTPQEVNMSIRVLKTRGIIRFVDWCPTGFKIGISGQPPSVVPGFGIAPTEKSVTMMTNSTAVADIWQRMGRKYDLLFARRAFVHWFVGEGMEEGEFNDARETMASVEKDYLEIAKDSSARDGAESPDADEFPSTADNSSPYLEEPI